MMIEGIIYKYTSPSGKVYIGQTIDEQNRRVQFLNDKIEYAGPKINKARLKYGVYNFDYEIIFKVCSNIKSEVKDILNEKEIQYINIYDSFNNGYNSDLGGNSCTYTRTEENKQKLSEQITNYYKTHKSSVAKPILQYTNDGKFIQEWESAKQAGDNLNIFSNSITTVCKGNMNTAGGFIWQYKIDNNIQKTINVKKHGARLPIIEYDKSGNELRRWDTMTKASIELGYSLGNFSTYCNGRNNHFYKGKYYYRGEKE